MTVLTTDTRTASPAGPLLDLDAATFAAHYNRLPFLFGHKLHDHPLMQLDALVDLANRLPRDQVRHSRGVRGFEADFDGEMRARSHTLNLDQVLQDMQHSDAYVLLHHPDSDPLYGRLLEAVVNEIRPFSEPLDPGMSEPAAYIFIASPGAVTPYHMDREMNFLCQVRGTKTVNLWNQDDPAILSGEQLDTLFGREDLPKPAYRPEYAARAMTFTLAPGLGVHQPFLAPHAVVNGDQISIAIAMTFRSKMVRRRWAIHQANYKLRQLGLTPGAYGTSPLADAVKHNAMRGYRAARQLVRAN